MNGGIYTVIVANNIGLAIRNEHVHIIFEMRNPYFEAVKEVLRFDSFSEPMLGGIVHKMELDTDHIDEDDFYKLIAYVDYADIVDYD